MRTPLIQLWDFASFKFEQRTKFLNGISNRKVSGRYLDFVHIEDFVVHAIVMVVVHAIPTFVVHSIMMFVVHAIVTFVVHSIVMFVVHAIPTLVSDTLNDILFFKLLNRHCLLVGIFLRLKFWKKKSEENCFAVIEWR